MRAARIWLLRDFGGVPASYRGGIWMNSASCSLVNRASRNFSFSASRMMPSRSLTASVCIADFGWNFSMEPLIRDSGNLVFSEYRLIASGFEYIQSTDSR